MSNTKLTVEALAYWYFRLNGFLTIPNFIVHPDEGSNQRTDIDILGVRFPNRIENIKKPMKDDAWLSDFKKPLIVLVEVKTGSCSINKSWLKNNEIIPHALNCVGAFQSNEIDRTAIELQKKGYANTDLYDVSLIAIGRHTNSDIAKYKQILWKQVVGFIHNRLNGYIQQKANHGQWDEMGKEIWRICADRTLQDCQKELRENHGIETEDFF